MEENHFDKNLLHLDRDGEYIVGMDISNFPQFLTTPMFNMTCCENDKYFEEITDPRVKMVMGIKRRYNNIFKYYEAMDIYNSYMEYLLEKYPSMKSIKRAIKCGYMEDYVPPKPLLKQSKENKSLLSAGVRPSKKTFDYDLTNMFIEINNQEIKTDSNDLMISPKLLKKKSKAAIEYSGSELLKEIRKSSLYSKAYQNAGFDVIKEYYNDLFGSSMSKTGKISEKSLTQKIREQEEYDNMSDAEKSICELDGYQAYQGRFVSNRQLELIELYKTLQEEGYDVSTQLKNSGMKKEAIKMVSKKIGLNQPMTKKELKKFKKRQKRERKQLENRKRGDQALTRFLTSNRINAIDDDLDSVLDFTFENFMNK